MIRKNGIRKNGIRKGVIVIDTSWCCSAELNQLCKETKQVQHIDNNRWLEVCKELLLLANKEKNAEMKVYALQNMAEASMHLNYMEDSISYIMEGLAICDNYHFVTNEANLYNLLGVILSKQSNEVQALDYFLKALECFAGKDDHLMMATIYNNIASLYVSLGDYETSMECYDIVKGHMDQVLELCGVNEIYIINEVNYLMNRCLTYCAMKEYSKALACQWELMKYEDMNEVAYIKQFFHIVNAKIGYNLGEFEQFKFYIRLLIQVDHGFDLKTEFFYEYIELLQYLIDSDEIGLAGQLLRIVEKNLKDTNSDTIRLAYYRVMANYYRATYQEAALASLYIDTYKLIKRQEDKMKETKVLSIKTKQRLHREIEEQSKYEKEVGRLKRRLEFDALTKLPNRYRLNEVCEEYFKRAIYEHTTFGILIIDIDYFKEYNDFHGHLEGDYCIKKIAEVIAKSSQGLFCSRFGGDEFFVVSFGKTEDEIYLIAKEIKNRVIELHLKQPDELDNQFVTVSQGICVGIPKLGHTYSDFVHSADMALYRGKNKRNSIFKENPDFQ